MPLLSVTATVISEPGDRLVVSSVRPRESAGLQGTIHAGFPPDSQRADCNLDVVHTRREGDRFSPVMMVPSGGPVSIK